MQWYLFFCVFFLAVYICFYVPGRYALARWKLRGLQTIVLSFVLGMFLWGFQGYVFGYLRMRWVTYIYIALCIACAVSVWKGKFFRAKWVRVLRQLRIRAATLLLIVIGTVVQMFPVFGSGMQYADGVRFYGPSNIYDGTLHLSYIQSLRNTFPPMNPSSLNTPLTHYHYWGDFVMAELARVWRLPIPHLFFQYMPIFLSVLTALATYALIRSWGGSQTTARWALFLLYFSGELTYVFMLILHNTFGFYTAAIDNGVGQLLNMPHAFGKLAFLSGLLPLHEWIRTKQPKWFFLTVLMFVPLVGYKIYYGLFAILGMTLVSVWHILRTFFTQKHTLGFRTMLFNTWRKTFFIVLSMLMYAALTAIIYFPANATAGGLFYAPLEWPKLFLGANNIDWNEWWLRQQVYVAAGNIRNIVIFNSIAVFMCLLSIHGTRLLGIFPAKKLRTSFTIEHGLFFIPGIILFTVLGLFTLQVSGMFNVFNFFVVTTVILSLFTAFLLDELWSSAHIFLKGVAVVVILLTIPRAVYEIQYYALAYLRSSTYMRISTQEEYALEYIRNSTPKTAIVQSHPNNTLDRITPYVAYFSGRTTYFTGVGGLETVNQPVKEKDALVTAAFQASSSSQFARALSALGVHVLYLRKTASEIPAFPLRARDFSLEYENDGALVYTVK